MLNRKIMKTVLIIGSGITQGLLEYLKHKYKEVDIAVCENEYNQLPIMYDEVVNLKPIPFVNNKRVDMQFYPKKKHSPKGHERPYMYHN
jgi:hypothetical protein